MAPRTTEPTELVKVSNRFAQATVLANTMPEYNETVKRYEELGLTTAEGQRLENRAALIQTYGRVTLLATGEQLTEAHADTTRGKGAWELFLERCGMTESGARNYMQVYREFKDQPEVIKFFKASSLYALSAPSTDPQVRRTIIDQAVESGHSPSVNEVAAKIKDSKEPEQVPSAKFAELTPEQKKQVNDLYADLQGKREMLAQWPVKEQATQTYHKSRQIHERAYNKAVGQMDKLSRTLNFDWRAQIDQFHTPAVAAQVAAAAAAAAPTPSVKAAPVREVEWTPAAYGIAGKKASFDEWGVGDEITTHDGRVALTHGQPTKNNRQVMATFLDGTDEELAGFSFVLMLNIARHRGWARGYERKEYRELSARISEARQRMKSAAQKAVENEPAPYINGNGNGKREHLVNVNGVLVREVVEETVPDVGTAVEDDFATEDDFDGEEAPAGYEHAHTIAVVDLNGDRQAEREVGPSPVHSANFAEGVAVYAPPALEEDELAETLRVAESEMDRQTRERTIIQFHIRNEIIRIITEAHLSVMPDGADEIDVQLPPEDELATACDTIRTVIREQVHQMMFG